MPVKAGETPAPGAFEKLDKSTLREIVLLCAEEWVKCWLHSDRMPVSIFGKDNEGDPQALSF